MTNKSRALVRLGRLFASLRDARGWNQQRLAEAAALHVNVVKKVEPGHSASIDSLERIAEALGHRLNLKLETTDAALKPADIAWLTAPLDQLAPNGEPPNIDYVAAVRQRVQDLIALDNSQGGDRAAPLAVALLAAVKQKMRVCRPGPLLTELNAAAGEVAEVIGWFAFDAQQHNVVRAHNLESLHFLQLAGDRSIALLTWQNHAMHEAFVGRPAESLFMAQQVLEGMCGPLSPRLRSLYHIREARALAQLGDAATARDRFERATALYWEGVRDTDPPWLWWAQESELTWHQSTAAADCGEWPRAVELLLQSVEIASSENRTKFNTTGDAPSRSMLLRHATLAHAQARAGLWRAAGDTLAHSARFVPNLQSSRTALQLMGAIRHVEQAGKAAGSTTRDTASGLRIKLAESGYDFAALRISLSGIDSL